jgi:hypothetical protein
MTTTSTVDSTTEVIEEASSFLVAGGILTFALAPLALPIIALTVVALIPIAAIGAVVGLAAAVVAAPILLVRRLVR